jgi:hypothetical protein
MVREVYVAIDKTRRLVRHEVGLATLEKNTAAASSGVLRTQLWSVGNKVEMAKPRKKIRYVIDGWADLTKVTNKPNSVCYNHMFSINIMQNFESFLVSRYFELNFL